MSIYWLIVAEVVLWCATAFLARLMHVKSQDGSRLSGLEIFFFIVIACGSFANMLAPLLTGQYAALDEGASRCIAFCLSAGTVSRVALAVLGYESGVIND